MVEFLLIAAKIDPNELIMKKGTPMHVGVYYHFVTIYKWLLSSIKYAAAQRQRTDIFDILCAHGANINYIANFQNPGSNTGIYLPVDFDCKINFNKGQHHWW